jgi:RNA polymerase sigma factor (sigma-70 family)
MSSTVVDEATDRAFERLYARHEQEVYRYVLAVLRNPVDAEDVTQTTFLNAYRAMRAGEEPRKPHHWLIAIAHNACYSRLRFARRRPKEVPLEAGEPLAALEPERPNLRELLRALRRLPSNQRAALTMRELEGRSYPEIAETLGVTVPAVEALIARARATLRRQAAALRGLVLGGLPRSLGEVALGKAAAVVATGVVAGSVGAPAALDAHAHAQQPVVRVTAPLPVTASVTPPPRVRIRAHRHPPGPAPAPAPALRSALPVPAPPAPPASAAPEHHGGPAPAPPRLAPAPAAAPAVPPPAAAVEAVVTSVVSTLPEPLPLPALPVPAPPVTALPLP